MKKGLILAMLGVGISLLAVGCSTYKGGMGEEDGTTYGTAADLRDPGWGGYNLPYGKPYETNIHLVPQTDLHPFLK